METDDAVTLIEDLDAPQQREVLDALPVKDRLEVEAGRVARDPRARAETRQAAQFIADFATALPCAEASSAQAR